ncbi:hypothetical protein A4S05_09960 [Nostoc sp. KVJ20]|uniref:hypothetical protein n=1 Tax=Nostoc sp. KVJ20 TaxID=457944 RepID=UPI00083E26EB|nr:hypothetical protein [Nostoc sp. KVJ20]ODG98239.1 hypothetical protein A4S05_09960 [Nostoc sp. KVJ20]
MNTNQDDTTSSKNGLQLPEPDPANITALSHNLPNTPIIPDVIKESVNAVLSLFRKRHTKSSDQPTREQQPNQAD